MIDCEIDQIRGLVDFQISAPYEYATETMTLEEALAWVTKLQGEIVVALKQSKVN